jgi:hypothetical protein
MRGLMEKLNFPKIEVWGNITPLVIIRFAYIIMRFYYMGIWESWDMGNSR